MAGNTSRGGGRKSATPVLSSDAAARIRERTQRAWERDVNFMVAERSIYRLLWPLVLMIATGLNILLAGDYMIRVADVPEGAPIVGISLAAICGAFFGALFLAFSWHMLALYRRDLRAKEWAREIPVFAVLGGAMALSALGAWAAGDARFSTGLTRPELVNWCIAFSLIVACRVLMVLNADDDTSGAGAWAGRLVARVVIVGLIGFSIWTAAAETATKLQKKADAGAAQSAAVVLAGDVVKAAGEGLQGAQGDLIQARRDLDDAKIRARQVRAEWSAYQEQHAGGDPWLLNATHSQGPAKPYIEAIQRADRAVEAGRARVDMMQGRVTAARRDALDAQRSQAKAVEQPGSEGTVIASLGELVPAWMGGPWSAEKLIVVWGLVVAVLLEVVCYAGAGATGRLLKGAVQGHAQTRGSVADEIRAEAREAASGAGQGQAQPQAAQPFANPQAGPSVPQSGGAVVDFSTRARHAEVIADAVADARSGILEDASFPTIKARYSVGHTGALAIRDALLREGVFVAGPGNTMIRAC